MKVSIGDVLVCSCGDCTIELKVNQACSAGVCGHEVSCDIDARCCGEPMKKK